MLTRVHKTQNILLCKFKTMGEFPHSDGEHWTVSEIEPSLYQTMAKCVREIVIRALIIIQERILRSLKE